MGRYARIAALAALFAGIAANANATTLWFTTSLSGPNEFPANASPGTGSADVFFDTVALTMRVRSSFSGLTGTTTAAHIHCCIDPLAVVPTAGVATTTPSFPAFPLGVTFGSFDQTYDMTDAASYRAGFITANGGTVPTARDVLLAGLLDGHAYFNIHTSTFGSGEIRGFLTKVPEPASIAIFGVGLAYFGLAYLSLQRRKSRAAKAA